MGWWEDLTTWWNNEVWKANRPIGGAGPGGAEPPTAEAILDDFLSWLSGVGWKVSEAYAETRVNASFVEAMSLLNILKDKRFAERVVGMHFALRDKVKSFSFNEFRFLWATARQYVGLQSRLALEQVFWNLGKPWSTLVTGFKAIDIEKAEGPLGDVRLPSLGEASVGLVSDPFQTPGRTRT